MGRVGSTLFRFRQRVLNPHAHLAGAPDEDKGPMQPQRTDTEACDGFEIGWGIVEDGRRIVVLTPKRHGIAIRQPIGFELELARALVANLQEQIARAEESQRPAN